MIQNTIKTGRTISITIKVIDSIMGSGKTTFAIEKMNKDTERKYIYITPFLDEITRIKHLCPNKRFVDPKNYDSEGHFQKKQDSLHNLLAAGHNIATTHALFKQSNEETKELIQAGNYVLILDEVMDVIDHLTIKKSDKELLFDNKFLDVDDEGYVTWNNEDEKIRDYDGKFNDIKHMANNRNLLFYRGSILIWTFPISIFDVFKEVFILTYLFDGQIQKYYYDLNSVKYEYYHVEKVEDELILKQGKNRSKHIKEKYKNLIDIYDGILNDIGTEKHSLSLGWYEKRNQSVQKLKNNVSNYFKHKMKAKSKEIIWTTFKDHKPKINGKGYQRSYIAVNLRATNDFRHTKYLAYAVNRYMNPIIEGFFVERGVRVNQELWATSELIQWIWRSSIRDDNKVYIYLPSKRMRDLLITWLET
ncbi:hypothetical protein [Paenibacillus sp. QZ-Y1]|uniref:hypothetical protein n=1 Tax=Paenibacillus sp. QZ-Y1 TaxID=3414511 RepID=UPI003F7B172F